MASDDHDPELAALRAELDRTYGKARWRCWRGVNGENGETGLLYAWLMPPTSPQVLLSARTPAAVEARIAVYYDVLTRPDMRAGRSAGSQAREAAEALDVTGLEQGEPR